MRLNWRRGLSRSLLLLALAGVGYMGLQWPSRLPELNCWSRFAKWPDGQPFSVFDLFEEANTPGNVEANRKREAWSADSIVTRYQWVVSTGQKLIACETGGAVAPDARTDQQRLESLRNSLLGLLLKPLAILLGVWIVRGFRPGARTNEGIEELLLQVSPEMNDDPENHNEYRACGRLRRPSGRTVLQRLVRHWQCDRRAAARETNGRYGYGGTVAPRPGDSPSAYAVQGRSGISAYAYSPTARGSIDRHRRHSR